MGKNAAILAVHAMLHPKVPCLAVEKECGCGRMGKKVLAVQQKLEDFL